MGASQRLSPTVEPVVSTKKSRSRNSHQDRPLHKAHSKHRHGKRKQKYREPDKVPSCSPSEEEEEDAGDSVRGKSVSAQRIVEIHSTPPSPPSDDETPYPAIRPTALEGSAGSPGVSCSTQSSTSTGDLHQSTTDATGDSQTTSKSQREPAEALLSSKDKEVTLEEVNDVLDQSMKEDVAVEDQIELEAEDHLMEEELMVGTVVKQEEEDMDETRGTEDGDMHGIVLASTVHKVDREHHNSKATLALPSSTRKKSRQKEHKRKSHEHKHHRHHQHKEHSRQEKHERHKKHERRKEKHEQHKEKHEKHEQHKEKHEQHKEKRRQPLPERERSIHERKRSSIKKKRKHTSHRD